jgi:predicted metalloprotease
MLEVSMRDEHMRSSQNVEDRRGQRSTGGGMRGLGGGKAAVGGVGGIILVIIVLFLGGNPQQLLNQMGQAGGTSLGGGGGGVGAVPAGQEKQVEFVKRVLGDTEDVWTRLYAERGKQYQPPVLVLFAESVDSACGFATSATGPFYCPADSKVYIDLSFYDDLTNKYGATGDFAQAYVIAHEIGHHIQNLTGVSRQVHAARAQVSETEYNQLSVRLELQADYYAGVWAHHAQKRGLLEAGDVDEALRAANAIGDDRLQREATGHVQPDSFTHGTSEQRMRWFRKGLESGDFTKGDTFSANPL